MITNETLAAQRIRSAQLYQSHFIFSDVFVYRASSRRLIAGLSGPLLMSIGCGISISARFGNFGFAVLLDGLYKVLPAPLWILQTIMTLVFYLIAWK